MAVLEGITKLFVNNDDYAEKKTPQSSFCSGYHYVGDTEMDMSDLLDQMDFELKTKLPHLSDVMRGSSLQAVRESAQPTNGVTMLVRRRIRNLVRKMVKTVTVVLPASPSARGNSGSSTTTTSTTRKTRNATAAAFIEGESGGGVVVADASSNSSSDLAAATTTTEVSGGGGVSDDALIDNFRQIRPLYPRLKRMVNKLAELMHFNRAVHTPTYNKLIHDAIVSKTRA